MANGADFSKEKKAELLHDHYKDSFADLNDNWKVRNRLFGLILVVLAAMLFQLTSPGVLERLANSYIHEQVKCAALDEASGVRAAAKGDDAAAQDAGRQLSAMAAEAAAAAARGCNVDFRFITSLLWFLLASLLVQYYQRSIFVDRMYAYMELVEGQFNELAGEELITREGSFYKTGRPQFLEKLSILYRRIFFWLLLPVMVAKLGQEWLSTWAGLAVSDFLFSVADTVIAAAIIYYTRLYRLWAHGERTAGDGGGPAPARAVGGEAPAGAGGKG